MAEARHDREENWLSGNDVAIVGMSLRVPGARTLEGFWGNVRRGTVSIRDLTDDEIIASGIRPSLLHDPNYIKRGGGIDDVKSFDAGFFDVGPRDAAIMDPQHRHFLECSWEALEDAGCVPKSFDGAIGVFAGCGMNEYMLNNLNTNESILESMGMFLLRHTGNDKDFFSTGLSYRLNLRGPSISVQTACSTSLVAVHLAVQSLLSGESDLALAGGATVQVPHSAGYLYREGEVLSPDGWCRPFDLNSNGTVLTSGVGVVALKRLSDAMNDGDRIYAVIKASAVNNDGSAKVSYLAPGIDGQAAVIAEALSVAGLSSDDIDYVEAHGTGTVVGDPIEVAALTQAFRLSGKALAHCRLGSVKANIGHTDTAAGVISLIAAALALTNRTLPPLANFTAPNPHINMENSPFLLEAGSTAWPSSERPRYAAVSSLGVGGTNAHVVLQESPAEKTSEPGLPLQVLPLSAQTATALELATTNLVEHLRQHPDLNLADVAYTLQEARAEFPNRQVLIVGDLTRSEADRNVARILGNSEGSPPRVVFVFPGGGSQYPNMGRELYESEPFFRDQVDECLSILGGCLEVDFKTIMFPDGNLEAAAIELAKPRYSLAAIFTVEYALARLLMTWGIEPSAMSGHSLGEYTAACIAGVLSVEDALAMVVARSLLIEKVADGVMLTVGLSEAELRPLLPETLSLASINAPELCVVSGLARDIEPLEAKLAASDIMHRRLRISAAGHSHLLDAVLDEFRAKIEGVRFNAPVRPYISNVTGDWAQSGEVQTADYWVRHLRNTVRFSDGLTTLFEDANTILVEVGPGRAMASLATMQSKKPYAAVTLLGMAEGAAGSGEAQSLLGGVGRLWTEGVAVNWQPLRGSAARKRVRLPSYPFERHEHWIEAAPAKAGANHGKPLKAPDISDWFYMPVWKRADLPLKSSPTEVQRWLLFVQDDRLSVSLIRQLRASGQDIVEVRPSSAFLRQSAESFKLRPDDPEDYGCLWREQTNRGWRPDHILHLWGTATTARKATLDAAFELGYASLHNLAQAIGGDDASEPIQLLAAVAGAYGVEGERAHSPERSIALGLTRVISRELPNIECQLVDLSAPAGRGKSLDALAAALLAEALSADPETLVALREDRRWTWDYQKVVGLDEPSTSSSVLKTSGVYLITGGLGALGLKLAHYLANTVQAKLVLVGRSAKEILQARSGHEVLDERTAAVISSLEEIESIGSEVMVASADVTDRAQMQEVIREAQRRFGRIDGIFHTAGILDDALIQTKSLVEARAVLAPKLQGTLVLDSLLPELHADFLALFSSTSAILGVAGQSDYTAANAFLDAYAASKASSSTRVISINWGLWASAADRTVAGKPRILKLVGTIVAPTAPLLQSIERSDDGAITAEGELDSERHWVLNEHRTKNGHAILPGTGYLELLAETMATTRSSSVLEIRDLYMSTALRGSGPDTTTIRVAAVPSDRGWDIKVVSGDEETIHAAGSARMIEVGRARDAALTDEVRCRLRETATSLAELTHQADFLRFGPRWSNLRSARFEGGEAIALVALPEEFIGDLEAFSLHPALMDVALGFALRLIPDYDQTSDLFVPLGYGRVRIFDRLPAKAYSRVRLSRPVNAGDKVASFDVTISDESGSIIVEVEEFSVRRLSSQESTGPILADPELSPTRTADLPPLLRLARTEGITPEEGMAALNRVLSRWQLPQAIISPLSLKDVERYLAEQTPDRVQRAGVVERPEFATSFTAPRDQIETYLAEAWQHLLGINRVGIHDDFFELGGHSLVAVRIFARVKQMYGIDVPLSALFNAPTVAAFASILRRELSLPDPEAADWLHGASADATKEHREMNEFWSSLVPIQTQGSARPFFCIHGMHGNVLNFRDIAIRMGDQQPFYGLQAVGLNGRAKPHETIEEMAEHYVREIKRVQPHGPYFLGGYSGGGLVAFEMTRQLQIAGEEVAVLAFLDSYCPTVFGRRSLGRKILNLVSGIREQGPTFLGQWLKRRARLPSTLERQNRPEALSELEVTVLGPAFAQAQDRYDPKPLAVNMTLLRAREAIGPLYMPADLGWRDLIEGKIEVIIVPGEHDSICLEPNVQVVAEVLSRRMKAAQGEHSSVQGNP